MNKITVDEAGLKDLHSIAMELLFDPNDPASPGYHRELHRPRIPWGAMAVGFLLPLCLCIAACLVLGQLWWIPVAALGVYLLLRLRSGLLFLILLYQRFAPSKIRCKCRFEPSCSQYTFQALEKYGLWQGLCLSVNRFKRCKPGDGGNDPLP